jgi:hypothetical protein
LARGKTVPPAHVWCATERKFFFEKLPRAKVVSSTLPIGPPQAQRLPSSKAAREEELHPEELKGGNWAYTALYRQTQNRRPAIRPEELLHGKPRYPSGIC